MWNGTKVVDVHGHISRPPQVRQFAAGLMSNRTPGKMNIPDDVTEPAFQRHIADMDDRLIDFQLVGPRPVDQWHWMPMFLAAVLGPRDKRPYRAVRAAAPGPLCGHDTPAAGRQRSGYQAHA